MPPLRFGDPRGAARPVGRPIVFGEAFDHERLTHRAVRKAGYEADWLDAVEIEVVNRANSAWYQASQQLYRVWDYWSRVLWPDTMPNMVLGEGRDGLFRVVRINERIRNP